ncbi:hypothetical protein PSHT_12776 [Puccinia striiformis]|uniref:Iron-sulfur assembly protein 1 n=2 Tax=Puccinia striiformis TaxID=27350 RepID=A0A2S4UUM9_9BASI|nr:hypothetical protein PSHT_12776 [Puccinia striiformis]
MSFSSSRQLLSAAVAGLPRSISRTPVSRLAKHSTYRQSTLSFHRLISDTNNIKLQPMKHSNHQDILMNSIPTPSSSSSSTETKTTTLPLSVPGPSEAPSQSQLQRETTSSSPTLQQRSHVKTPASQLKRTTTTRSHRPAKQVINLTPKAIDHLSTLLDGPQPKLIRIGVKNKGCAGMAYNLDYVDQPGKFDEIVVTENSLGQEIRVLIDSRALFSIIGSTMDWQESKLGNKFVFDNPNIKEECGCGESFLV